MKDAPKLKASAHYVLKHRDKLLFVGGIHPLITETPRVEAAYVFEGKWLNDTCWKFRIFWTPVDAQEAKKLFTTNTTKSKTTKHKTRNVSSPSRNKKH